MNKAGRFVFLIAAVMCGIICLSCNSRKNENKESSSEDQADVQSGVKEEAPAFTSNEKIKIGVITYMSSARAATMGFFQIGWEAAGDQINRAGGIDGKEVKFILLDPQNDASLIPQRLTDAKNQGCAACIFAVGDDLAPAAAEWAEENKYPVLFESNTSTEISIKHFSKYAFNCGLNAWAFAKILAKVAVGEEGKKNFVFCGTDGAATIDAENLLLLEGKKINPAFKLLASYRISSDDSEFSKIISTITSTAPDMVLQQGGGPTFVSFAQQGNLFGLFNVSDIYNDFVIDTSTNEALSESGDYPYGHTHGIFLLPFFDESMMDAEVKNFCTDYMKNQIAVSSKYIAPSDSGFTCYRCCKSILLGIQKCLDEGKDYKNSEVLSDAIRNISWKDSTGEHKFRELDNQLTFDVYYGTSTKKGSEAFGGNPVAADIHTFTADEILPTKQEMKSYAEKLGVAGSRFN